MGHLDLKPTARHPHTLEMYPYLQVLHRLPHGLLAELHVQERRRWPLRRGGAHVQGVTHRSERPTAQLNIMALQHPLPDHQTHLDNQDRVAPGGGEGLKQR